jgi:hypothetical protein
MAPSPEICPVLFGSALLHMALQSISDAAAAGKANPRAIAIAVRPYNLINGSILLWGRVVRTVMGSFLGRNAHDRTPVQQIA